MQRYQPASLRLLDNEQFEFGQALRPAKGPFGLLLDGIKHFYLTRLKGLDIKKICVATIVMEGSASEVAIQEARLNKIGLAHNGIPAGEHNGKRGYQLTFVIAYIRVSSFYLYFLFVSHVFQNCFIFMALSSSLLDLAYMIFRIMIALCNSMEMVMPPIQI